MTADDNPRGPRVPDMAGSVAGATTADDGSPRGLRMPELLAPAGSPAAFHAALAGGADAIYCALGDDFNARRMAEGFDDASFEECCRLAHLLGARVYATVNIVIKQDEMTAALNLARRALELGADALIIQDWGLLFEVRRLLPHAEVHASTQCNVHDARGVRWCAERAGVSRVTLSRELPLPEIAACAATGVEREVFAHGAICFAYSGVCLMSSLRGGRSGNRGQCANPCRLPHDLLDAATGELLAARPDLRPLCPKDNCTVDALDELAEAGAASLKLEGRLKEADYVYAVTSAYRDGLDAASEGRLHEGDGPERRRHALKRVFNRGLTDAYLRGKPDNSMISYGRSNNRGEVVGTVTGSRRMPDVVRRRKGKNGGRERTKVITRYETSVALDGPVGAGDIIEFRRSERMGDFVTAPVLAAARAGEAMTCETPKEVPSGSVARIVRSQAALDAAARVTTSEGVLAMRRRSVDVRVVARLGEPLLVELSTCDGAAHASATGPTVEEARTRALDRDELAEHVCRMGSTCFEPMRVEVELDGGCGLPFSAVHRTRAQACESLEQAILSMRHPPTPSTPGGGCSGQPADRPERSDGFSHVPDDVEPRLSGPGQKSRLGTAVGVHGTRDGGHPVDVCVLSPSPGHARAAIEAGAVRVYAPSDALAEGEWPEATVPVLDEICREPGHARLDGWVRPGGPVAVGNVSELALAEERGADAELRSCIPVHNTWTIDFLASAGARAIWLSPEVSLSEIPPLAAHAAGLGMPVGIQAYGPVRVMTSEHCVLQAANRCKGECASCEVRRRDTVLKTIDGDLLSVRTDMHGRSRIYHSAPLDLVPEIGPLLEAGVTRFLVDTTFLDPAEVAAEVARVLKAVARARCGQEPLPRRPDASAGLLHSGIL